MSEKAKKRFLGLFRSKSAAGKGTKDSENVRLLSIPHIRKRAVLTFGTYRTIQTVFDADTNASPPPLLETAEREDTHTHPQK